MSRVTLRLATLVVVAIAFSVPAMALNLVNASAPQVNCVWSTTCSVTVTDMSYGLLSGGFLRSRYFQGQAGSPAAGKWAYWYRLDLTNASTALDVPYATSVISPVGTALQYDYNYDGYATDQVFVITSGGLGSVGLSSVGEAWGLGGFNFNGQVWAGQSSYFYGFTSAAPPTIGNIVVSTSHGNITVQGYVPSY